MSGDFEEKQVSAELVEAAGDETVSRSIAAFSSDESLIGQTVGGHYEILSKVGSGGMSTVFEARHLLLDRLVAIKMILPQLVHDEHTAMRFQQEAKAAAELEHPNICSVKEFGVDEASGRAYIVMDLLEGITLQELIEKEGKTSSTRAVEIVSQICSALEFAHGKGVIHRDIKPSNIVLFEDKSGEEKAKLVDFGIAKLTREGGSGPDLTKTGEVFGTPKYMSPEQCLGKSVDSRTDIYSVGCVLFEMLAGCPPFQGDSSLEIMMKHINDSPPQISRAEVEPWLKNIALKSLEKDPQYRYQNIAELQKDLAGRVSPRQRGSLARRKSIITNLVLLAVLIGLAVNMQSILMSILMFFSPTPPDQCLNMSVCEIKDGDFDMAERYAARAAASREYAAKGHMQLGRVKAAKKDFAAALKELSRAVELEPQYAHSYLCRGDVYLRVGDEKSAQHDLLKALSLYSSELETRKSDPYVLANRALTYTKLKRYREAIDDLDKAISLVPGKFRNYYDRGVARYLSGDLQGSIRDYSKAIEREPGSYLTDRGIDSDDNYGDWEVALMYGMRSLALEKSGDTDGYLRDRTMAERIFRGWDKLTIPRLRERTREF